ncbi:MAG: aminotransferase class III-fold pyridoxal phosphate-dependent enzyme, partial [Rikenellaceae bacterium]
AENAAVMGELFRNELRKINSPAVEVIRGKGLLNAVVIKPHKGKTAWDLCLLLRDRGLLAKPTHDHIIRFAPPLVITKEQIMECVAIIADALKEYHK